MFGLELDDESLKLLLELLELASDENRPGVQEQMRRTLCEQLLLYIEVRAREIDTGLIGIYGLVSLRRDARRIIDKRLTEEEVKQQTVSQLRDIASTVQEAIDDYDKEPDMPLTAFEDHRKRKYDELESKAEVFLALAKKLKQESTGNARPKRRSDRRT